jgi:hypothetical protein
MKTFLTILLVIILCINKISAQDATLYISPGIGLSWDLNGNFIISPKLSIGYYSDSKFINLTVGRVSGNNNLVYPYYFIEGQYGVLSEPMEFRKLQLFSSIGVGINIHSNEEYRSVSFRSSLFFGYGAFLKATIITKEKINADIGIEAVAPIPMNFKLGSPGG